MPFAAVSVQLTLFGESATIHAGRVWALLFVIVPAAVFDPLLSVTRWYAR
jgi:hypothetical protein